VYVQTVVQVWQKDKALADTTTTTATTTSSAATDSTDSAATVTIADASATDISLLEKNHLLMCMALCNRYVKLFRASS
jgi:hypothetical protein